MTTQEIKELEAWIAEHVFGLITHPIFKAFYCQMDNHDVALNKDQCRYATDSAAALAVLKKCYEYDRNSCLASFHNFLMRKDHDTTLTELQICLFAKKLFTK